MHQKRTPLEKEWAGLEKREKLFLEKRKDQKDGFVKSQLETKVPARLQSTLDAAFEKAFCVIFEKGSAMIDRTFDRKKREDTYKIDEFTDSVKKSRKTLRTFSKRARTSGKKNLLISGTAGIGMGLVGIGVPDIPIFTAILLKSIYEIALSFGFAYDTEKEHYFILMLICGGVSRGKEMMEIERDVNLFIDEDKIPEIYVKENLIKRAAQSLSSELLYMKFLQGVPLVGIIGGAYDVIYMKRITEYANLKYQRRFLKNRNK